MRMMVFIILTDVDGDTYWLFDCSRIFLARPVRASITKEEYKDEDRSAI